VLALPGCTRTRWECEACLKSDPGRCATSSRYRNDVSEEGSRCSAGSELCQLLLEKDGAAHGSVCVGKRTDPMLGCEPAFLDQLATSCSAHTEISVPLVGVK